MAETTIDDLVKAATEAATRAAAKNHPVPSRSAPVTGFSLPAHEHEMAEEIRLDLEHHLIGQIDENVAVAFGPFFADLMSAVEGREVFWRVLPKYTVGKDFETNTTKHQFYARLSTMAPPRD